MTVSNQVYPYTVFFPHVLIHHSPTLFRLQLFQLKLNLFEVNNNNLLQNCLLILTIIQHLMDMVNNDITRNHITNNVSVADMAEAVKESVEATKKVSKLFSI